MTIKVADGVTADDIKVVDKNGKLVEIKKIDDNTYTFVMPASDVNVSGTVEDLRLNDTDHFAYITGYPDGTFKPNGNLTRAGGRDDLLSSPPRSDDDEERPVLRRPGGQVV